MDPEEEKVAKALGSAGQIPGAEELEHAHPGMTPPSSFLTPTPGSMAAPRPIAPARPYQKVPDSLMGYRKTGPNKSFDENRYPHIQHVEITLPDGQKFVDAIKGMNQAHALERASRNWEGASIRAITEKEAMADPDFGGR
jgi:hypothetical protein